MTPRTLMHELIEKAARMRGLDSIKYAPGHQIVHLAQDKRRVLSDLKAEHLSGDRWPWGCAAITMATPETLQKLKELSHSTTRLSR